MWTVPELNAPTPVEGARKARWPSRLALEQAGRSGSCANAFGRLFSPRGRPPATGAAQRSERGVVGRLRVRPHVTLQLIEPGKPTQNAYVESSNGRFRDECLNEHWFTSMAHAQAIIEAWRREYNEERPKKGLGGLTPDRYAKRMVIERSPAFLLVSPMPNQPDHVINLTHSPAPLRPVRRTRAKRSDRGCVTT